MISIFRLNPFLMARWVKGAGRRVRFWTRGWNTRVTLQSWGKKHSNNPSELIYKIGRAQRKSHRRWKTGLGGPFSEAFPVSGTQCGSNLKMELLIFKRLLSCGWGALLKLMFRFESVNVTFMHVDTLSYSAQVDWIYFDIGVDLVFLYQPTESLWKVLKMLGYFYEKDPNCSQIQTN